MVPERKARTDCGTRKQHIQATADRATGRTLHQREAPDRAQRAVDRGARAWPPGRRFHSRDRLAPVPSPAAPPASRPEPMARIAEGRIGSRSRLWREWEEIDLRLVGQPVGSRRSVSEGSLVSAPIDPLEIESTPGRIARECVEIWRVPGPGRKRRSRCRQGPRAVGIQGLGFGAAAGTGQPGSTAEPGGPALSRWRPLRRGKSAGLVPENFARFGESPRSGSPPSLGNRPPATGLAGTAWSWLPGIHQNPESFPGLQWHCRRRHGLSPGGAWGG